MVWNGNNFKKLCEVRECMQHIEQYEHIHTVMADFNRQGERGTVKVNLRRFAAVPDVDDTVRLVDGEDTLYGVVYRVKERHVLILLTEV